MLALRLVLTALADIFRGFSQTLRIVLVPAVLFYAGQTGGFYLAAGGASLQVIVLLSIPLALICGTWAGVNYHRKVLLGERFGWWPTVHVREMLGYGLTLIPMGLAVLALAIVVQMLLFRLAFPVVLAPGTGGDVHPHIASMARVNGFVGIVSGILSTALALRLFSMLPAIAIGAPMTNVFRGHRGVLPTLLLAAAIVMIAGVMLVVTVMAMIIDFLLGWSVTTMFPPMVAVMGKPPALAILIGLSAMTQVFQAVFGVALVTVIYGHYSGRRVLR